MHRISINPIPSIRSIPGRYTERKHTEPLLTEKAYKSPLVPKVLLTGVVPAKSDEIRLHLSADVSNVVSVELVFRIRALASQKGLPVEIISTGHRCAVPVWQRRGESHAFPIFWARLFEITDYLYPAVQAETVG